ncbi:hypothetical protein V6N13_123097 [Hibiscus sabdariffa]
MARWWSANAALVILHGSFSCLEHSCSRCFKSESCSEGCLGTGFGSVFRGRSFYRTEHWVAESNWEDLRLVSGQSDQGLRTVVGKYDAPSDFYSRSVVRS